MLVGEDAYDLPFVVVDVSFTSGDPSKLFVEFESKPLVKDEQSMRKYVDPLRGWHEEMGRLPSEPLVGFQEPGKFLKSNLSPIHYLRYVPTEYTNKVVELTRQFFNIYLDFYHKAVPVTDEVRRHQMDSFRTEYNRHAVD